MIKTIAEIGINHNGDIDIAEKLIDVAVVAGFDYVKFQKRNIDMAVPEHKKNEPKKTPWGDMTYYEYKKRIEFNEQQYKEIFDYCESKKIKCFASVWDFDSCVFMTQFTDIVKIPSACLTDDALLAMCREKFGTVILSTGMSTEKQIEHAWDICGPDVIMHTNSSYPAKDEELNLSYIKWLQDKYGRAAQIGYSGHEYGLATTFAAAGMGVTWIERHITLDHDMWGSDQKASVDPVGAIKLIRGIKSIEAASGGYAPREIYPSEMAKLRDLRKK
jgi:N-acetylneuraminate synthase